MCRINACAKAAQREGRDNGQLLVVKRLVNRYPTNYAEFLNVLESTRNAAIYTG
jgi:hypothetical protein